jgi:cyclomaltodextrinase
MIRYASVALVSLVCLQASAADWFADAVWYQIFPERFRNGDPANDPDVTSLEGTWPYRVPDHWHVSPWTSDWYQLQPWEAADGRGFYHHAQLRRYGGDLQGILDELDYLQKLGVNALYLNPIFESPSLHKYGATMFHHVDRHFGPDPEGDLKVFAAEDPADPKTWKWTAADTLFLKLVNEVHRRKMHLIIDGVFNHVGINFWALQRAKREGPGSPFAKWFEITRWDDPATPQDEFQYQGWYGIRDLPQFNRTTNNLVPEVREHLHAVVQRWMDPNGDGDPGDGIDGWRLDVAAEVPMGFWREFHGWVKAINPEAYLTGEIWWENFQANTFRNARPWLDAAFDGVMNYRFGDAVFQFFNQPESITATQFGQLLTAMQRDCGYERTLNLQNLYDSHDTSRIGSAVVNPQYRQDHGGDVAGNRSYRVRAPNATEKEKWKQMVAFQFLAPGAPCIYYGDEVGMWGADDPDCRKPMVWADLKYDDETALPFGGKRPADQVAVDEDLLGFYRTWMENRNQFPVLRRGEFKILLTDDSKRVFAFERTRGEDAIAAVFNASDDETRLRFDRLGIGTPSEWSAGLRSGGKAAEELTVPARGQLEFRRTKK